MAKGKGIQLDSSGDLLIANGEMAIGDVTYQNAYLILVSHKGEWKEYPLLGVGISDSLADEDSGYWKYAIRNELAKDGLSVTSLRIINGEIQFDVKYK